MKNQYYKKDKRVKLITQSSERDAYGNMRKVYRYLTNQSLWAYATQLSQSQTFEAAQYGNNEVRLFVLNYRHNVKVYDFVEYKDKFYSITRVDTKDDYNGELFVYVRDTTSSEKPTNIQPASN